MSGILLSKRAIEPPFLKSILGGRALRAEYERGRGGLHISPLRASVLSFGEEDVPDVARCGRKSGTAGLSPSGLVNLVFVANR